MDWLAAHVHEAVMLASALFGVWAVLHRGRMVLREEIRDYAATKEDVARLDAKLETLLTVQFGRARKRTRL